MARRDAYGGNFTCLRKYKNCLIKKCKQYMYVWCVYTCIYICKGGKLRIELFSVYINNKRD